METNKINKLFGTKQGKVLSIYFTAGYPKVDSTEQIILALQKNGVDLVEVGMPYSDPLADGSVIQQTSTMAISNGMTIKLLFEQLASIKEKVDIPLVLMGYLNPVLKYGIEKFCEQAKNVGVSGVIIPDIPLDEYEQHYKSIFEQHSLRFVFLITPRTTEERIRQIDKISNGFIYAVSSSSITGKENRFSEPQRQYLSRIGRLNLHNPVLVGFGIHNAETFRDAIEFCRGAIIGSAFLKRIGVDNDIEKNTRDFLTLLSDKNKF